MIEDPATVRSGGNWKPFLAVAVIIALIAGGWWAYVTLRDWVHYHFSSPHAIEIPLQQNHRLLMYSEGFQDVFGYVMIMDPNRRMIVGAALGSEAYRPSAIRVAAGQVAIGAVPQPRETMIPLWTVDLPLDLGRIQLDLDETAWQRVDADVFRELRPAIQELQRYRVTSSAAAADPPPATE